MDLNNNSDSDENADDELSDFTDEDLDELGIKKITFVNIGQYMLHLSNVNNENSDSSSTSTSDEERRRKVFLAIGKQMHNNEENSEEDLIMECISDSDDIFYLSD